MIRAGWFFPLLLVTLAVGCSAPGTRATQTPSPPPAASPATAVATVTPSPPPAASPATVVATVTPSPTLSPSPEPLPQDLLVTRLTIPALDLDSEVQRSQIVPDSTPSPPGCPAPPPGQETLTVPAQGIATPEDAVQGLENKAWIFGHSRWQGQPGLFFVIEDVSVGVELFVDGFDRQTGAEVTRQRYLVEGIYLTDRESGGRLVTADAPGAIPAQPLVILQTSVREAGANKQWLLDQDKVLAKASNLIEGDIDDPCKYLLLFVIAGSS